MYTRTCTCTCTWTCVYNIYKRCNSQAPSIRIHATSTSSSTSTILAQLIAHAHAHMHALYHELAIAIDIEISKRLGLVTYMYIDHVTYRDRPSRIEIDKRTDYVVMSWLQSDCDRADCRQQCARDNIMSYTLLHVPGARSQVLPTPHVPGPYRAAAKAWVQRAYPRSSTRSSDGVGSVLLRLSE